MSISDKTRKMLWGRSGSLCAFCKTHLVVDASDTNAESVVGDECHIVSGARGGPRYDSSVDSNVIDRLDNLLLLCRVHHKLVDDQPETFTANALRQLKAGHEKWIKERLTQPSQADPVTIVRSTSEIPKFLAQVCSAKDLLDLSSSCHGRYDDYPTDLSDMELDCVGSFLQSLTDWTDLGLDEPHERISAQKSLAQNLGELDRAGLRVYIARERQRIRGGLLAQSEIYALHVRIVRCDDPSQVPVTRPEV